MKRNILEKIKKSIIEYAKNDYDGDDCFTIHDWFYYFVGTNKITNWPIL
jgi:hypothetical protein